MPMGKAFFSLRTLEPSVPYAFNKCLLNGHIHAGSIKAGHSLSVCSPAAFPYLPRNMDGFKIH